MSYSQKWVKFASVGNLLFASDFHLGVPNRQDSLSREKKIVQWLEQKAETTDELFFVGDIFDFWFEYKHVVPKGFTRLLGCLARLSDSGIRLHFFKGNHDMWMFGYFQDEFGAAIHSDAYIFEQGGKRFFVHHGDGLGNGDASYKLLKKVFRSEICQRMFAFLHPYLGIGLANYLSQKSRAAQLYNENENIIPENEWLVQYCKEVLKKEFYDYLIFGHRHLLLDIELDKGSRYVNLGDWFRYCSYAEFDGTELALKKFESV